jgi:RNA-directed DNA polymerase
MVNGPEGPLRDLDADGWDRIDWRACEETVRRLRGRIFMAAQEENWPPFGACLSRVRRRAACTVLTTSRMHGSEGAERRNASRLPGEVMRSGAVDLGYG